MFNFTDQNSKVLIYAEQAFSKASRAIYPLRAKTADGYIRYAKTEIVGVVDSSATESNVGEILGIREDIPMISSIEGYLSSHEKPDVLLIGIAPSGGNIDEAMRNDIKMAIEAGVHIMSGMHYELNEDSELTELAQTHGVMLWDVRVPPENIDVATCRAYFVKKPIILTCAADAAIGKMTVGFEIENQLAGKNMKGEMLATGQTSIMVKGKGISIDRVIGDFMPGAVEKLVVEADPANRFLVIEGQGGLSHPGYAPVTLALLHGGMPTHAILIVRPQRKHSIGSKLIQLPSIQDTINMYKVAALPIRVPEFIGIALHSKGLSDSEADRYLRKYREESGLPVEDMIRFPTGELADAVERIVIDYEDTIT